jgi:hypothetical protein
MIVTNNNGFGLDDWIYWLLLAQSFVITITHTKWLPRLAPFWLDYGWLHSGLSLFWSQLRLTSFSSQSQNRIATDGRSVSHSVLVSSSTWGLWQDIYYCFTVTVLLLCGALSDERTGLSFVRAIVCSSKLHSHLNGLLYSLSVSTETLVDPTATCWFSRNYLHGNTFHFHVP